MSAAWQTQPAAAKAQAESWIAGVASTKKWTSAWKATAQAHVDAAYAAAQGEWGDYGWEWGLWEEDESATQAFWSALHTSWSGQVTGPAGWTDLTEVWRLAAGAAVSAAAEGIDLEDIEETINDALEDTGTAGKGIGAGALVALAIALWVFANAAGKGR